MAFFDEIGSKLTQTGQKTKQMANNLVDTAKLTTRTNELSKSLQETYATLGQQYFELHGSAPEEAMGPTCAQAKALLDEIELVRADLQRLKNIRLCPQCQHENQPDACFCGKCSAQLPELPQRPQPEQVFCPSCGNQLSPTAQFCTKCGTKMD